MVELHFHPPEQPHMDLTPFEQNGVEQGISLLRDHKLNQFMTDINEISKKLLIHLFYKKNGCIFANLNKIITYQFF